ncbi:unnamed protein product, partial [Ilex paraguariensis]
VKAETTKPLKPKSAATHSPVEVPRRRDFYFRSARSLAGSDTPPFQSYIKPKSGPSALERDADSSSEDEPLPPSSLTNPVTQPWRISRSGGYGTFLAATAANFPLPSNSLKEVHINQTGRRLLQEDNSNIYGQSLGWLMAAIYMGGRVPQIWLNIKRGSVEGLNPLMFIFALIANATYVGSILVRSTEWEKIKANLPWLLDAIVCVLLDLLIILQFIYYKYIGRKKIHYVG